ncbi:MAG: hypothetical protein WA418_11800 [Bradyrhizobium sp.]
MWRLFALAAGQRTALDTLPRDWLRVPRSATLTSAAEWARALDQLTFRDTDPRPILMPLLTLLERGTVAAEEAADALLRGAPFERLYHDLLAQSSVGAERHRIGR